MGRPSLTLDICLHFNTHKTLLGLARYYHIWVQVGPTFVAIGPIFTIVIVSEHFSLGTRGFTWWDWVCNTERKLAKDWSLFKDCVALIRAVG